MDRRSLWDGWSGRLLTLPHLSASPEGTRHGESVTTPAPRETESKSQLPAMQPLTHPHQPPIRLHPTIPPSTNNLYANLPRGGRVPTKAYKAWRAVNTVLCKQQLAGRKIMGPVAVEILIRGGKGWNEARDIGNVEKPLVDLIVILGIIPDDNCKVVRDTRIRYLAADTESKSKAAAITVMVKEWEEMLWVSP